MKIRTIFLALVLAATAPLAHAKDAKKPTLADTTTPQIEANLQKMFEEADKFYAAAKKWEIVKCEPKTGFICTKRECVRRDVKTFIVLNKKLNSIKRCDDSKYCEEFPASYNQTGVFYNIQSDGPVGTLIRVLGDSRYKEISTVGLDAYIANGECINISQEQADALGKAENPEAALVSKVSKK